MAEGLLKASSFVLSSNLLRLISKFLSSVVSAKILGPTSYGFYNLMDLIVKYGPLLNLGVASGISRDIPISLGRGDLAQAETLNDAGFTGLLATGLLSFVVICSTSFLFYSGLALWGITFAAASIVTNAVFEYQIMYLYSYSNFKRASFLISVNSVTNLVATISLVYFWGIHGQFVAILLVPVVVIMVAYLKGYHSFKFNFSLRIYKGIVKIGFPLILVGIGYTFLITIDRVIIAKYLGVEQLGFYSLAIMAFVFSQQVPIAISQVIYPKMNFKFGVDTNPRGLEYTAVLPSLILSLVMPLAMVVSMLFLPPIVKMFLGEYTNGIVSSEIILIPVSFYGVNILNTIFKIKELIVSLLSAIILKVAISIILIRLHFGIDGVAVASAVSLIAYTATISVISMIYLGKRVPYIVKYLLLVLFLPVLFVSSFVLYLNHVASIYAVGALSVWYMVALLYLIGKTGLKPALLFDTFDRILA
ncbi:MAG: oligosaccharide flippase family protein [Bacteroidetes bacterium]|nr:oligosaccharide flippase family protein [Bacteroidota bacterium]